jgi:hypothetical protein
VSSVLNVLYKIINKDQNSTISIDQLICVPAASQNEDVEEKSIIIQMMQDVASVTLVQSIDGATKEV